MRGLLGWLFVIASIVAIIGFGIGVGTVRDSRSTGALASASPSPSPTQVASSVLFLTYAGPASTSSDLMAYDPNTNRTATVTSLQHPPGFIGDLFLSPQRTRIAWLEPLVGRGSSVLGAYRLSTLAATGAQRVLIDEQALVSPDNPPVWSLDDATITYGRKAADGSVEIVTSPAAQSAAVRNWTTPRAFDAMGAVSAGLLGISNDGRGNREFTLLKADGTQQRLAPVPAGLRVPVQFAGNLAVFENLGGSTSSVSVFDAGGNAAPRPIASVANDSFDLSRDGTRLLLSDFPSYKTGTSRLRVQPIAGSVGSTLTTTSGRLSRPVPGRSWSPDGGWIAVESDDAQRNTGIEVLRNDGSRLVYIAAPSGGSLHLVGWR